MSDTVRATADRYLYLVRHGEATADESGLTDVGREQARALGRRLRGVGFDAFRCGPLPRAVETARLVAAELGDGGAAPEVSRAAGDYVPYVPERAELPAEHAAFADRLADVPADERRQGRELAARALAEFTGPVPGPRPRRELVVTHAFLVAHLVAVAHHAPPWRWMGLNPANAGLTVIRYAADRPAAVLCFNDLSHLPEEARWTGFPPELHV
ncbi:histidine phosphatase family protein [Streptomyces alkaliterrae]|uniref:Histidine phosphatase family protein n=1 Tax=Streptomyces alkaliterrae TaxID=2213162 RepID=A0A5P0YQK6_9ACTN|nr:histidine phosphatase family protein [Streptomyces alkaliterrae]MBB1253057.1 histidine phosphatase family protein [Streptomyces alkaliterrae]MBB1257882.1 histidine phosphatase family protein [Streptomyces alkaliterrae]MQS02538.1 histidine phosphatase family protein [Streptomyces alkaliterrae]